MHGGTAYGPTSVRGKCVLVFVCMRFYALVCIYTYTRTHTHTHTHTYTPYYAWQYQDSLFKKTAVALNAILQCVRTCK